MTIRTAKLAIAIALISPMAVATSNQALAVSVPGGSVAVKAAAPTASAKVKYRHHTVRHYQNYAPGDFDLTTPTMGPWGRSITRHPGINYRGNNRRSAAIRADFAEKGGRGPTTFCPYGDERGATPALVEALVVVLT